MNKAIGLRYFEGQIDADYKDSDLTDPLTVVQDSRDSAHGLSLKTLQHHVLSSVKTKRSE